MSKVTYNGSTYNIVSNRMLYDDGRPRYHILDSDGYRRITNFTKSSLKIYQRAIELSGEGDRNLKIVLDFAPYSTDGETLQNIDRHHSFWVQSSCCNNLSDFWELYDCLTKHPSAIRFLEDDAVV